MHIVGGYARQVQLPGQIDEPVEQPVVVELVVLLQFDIDLSTPKDIDQTPGACARLIGLVLQKCCGYFPAPATAQRNQPGMVVVQHVPIRAWHALARPIHLIRQPHGRVLHMGAGEQAAEVRITLLCLCQQCQMRA